MKRWCLQQESIQWGFVRQLIERLYWWWCHRCKLSDEVLSTNRLLDHNMWTHPQLSCNLQNNRHVVSSCRHRMPHQFLSCRCHIHWAHHIVKVSWGHTSILIWYDIRHSHLSLLNSSHHILLLHQWSRCHRTGLFIQVVWKCQSSADNQWTALTRKQLKSEHYQQLRSR